MSPNDSAGVERTIGIQPPDAATRLASQHKEVAPHQDLAALFNGEREYRALGSRIESGVERAIGIQPAYMLARLPTQCGKGTADQNLAICLEGQGQHPWRPD